ncbi:MAG: hypothetical protein TRG1_2032 [Flavobacteriaceae bacterium FS1-H7996/R]|nr:MAG: hypothetical protein TRG1_2032 [Flavobacteriaceae bacterium FS1-H7996/R]
MFFCDFFGVCIRSFIKVLGKPISLEDKAFIRNVKEGWVTSW